MGLPAAGARIVLALTGVPGTGKTTVAEALARRGVRVVHLNDFARAAGLLAETDAQRGSFLVDLDELAERLNTALATQTGAFVVEGHFAHEMDVDGIVLLRVDPSVLIARLEARGWPAEKVRENVEAEALDVLAAEVLDAGVPGAELDASRLSVEEVADRVYAIAESGPEALKAGRVGTVHWSLESLPWF